jgi:hypothetical protein
MEFHLVCENFQTLAIGIGAFVAFVFGLVVGAHLATLPVGGKNEKT